MMSPRPGDRLFQKYLKIFKELLRGGTTVTYIYRMTVIQRHFLLITQSVYVYSVLYTPNPLVYAHPVVTR